MHILMPLVAHLIVSD